MTSRHHHRLIVRAVTLDDRPALGRLVDELGGPGALVAVGVPVVTGDGEDDAPPRLAPGVPDGIPLGTTTLDCTVDPDRCRSRGYTGKTGEVLVVPGAHGVPSIVYVGCGSTADLDGHALRRAAAVFVRHAGKGDVGLLALPAAGPTVPAAQAAAEGAVLGAYRYVDHKSADGPTPLSTVILAGDGDRHALEEGVRRATVVADAVCFARDLVNEPPSNLTPRLLAEAAGDYLSSRPRTSLEVWDEERINAERLGGLLGVARGSAEPPRLLWARYQPAGDGQVAHVVLVGKGITFDSGGLSLKSGEGMMTMKTDMSGAAAVLATIGACEALGVAVRVTAIAPVTENMPGGRATKPGDVLTVRDGQTIEVLNTDAEGRLVLADGLTLARELDPAAIVDLATLTGACVVALGDKVAGLFGNDEALVAQVQAAAARAGEPVWRLPIVEEYRSHIDSEVADMKNIGKTGQAGAIAAALLLARFTEGTPWVHLDIAGPARSDEDKDVLAKGGTGFGVRTLLELVESFAG